MACSLDAYPGLAAFLARRAVVPGAEAGISGDGLRALCEAEDLSALLYQRIRESGADCGCPQWLITELAEKARAEAAVELLRADEIRAVLEGLAIAGIRPILLKGTALAYTVYPCPAARPRNDTDFLIASSDVGGARHVFASLGYSFSVHCSDLFSQFEVQKSDRFGVPHVFDVHWKISTQPVFADVLTHAGMLPRAIPAPALGELALVPDCVDALLLACVHPVMHHRNEERVLWMYDIHLLAERLAAHQFDEFLDLALGNKVAAICLHELRMAQTMFGTAVPSHVLAGLARAGDAEPSAGYLASKRTWRHELVSSVRGLPSLGARTRLLREVLLPGRDYMLGLYDLRGKPFAPWLLPALYLHRNVRGVWRILSGKK